MATTKIDNPNLFDFSSLNTALQLPTGDTASRPSSPSTGEWRYNNEDKYVEYWDGGAWRQIETEEFPTVPSENFNTVLYVGNGGTQAITGAGFSPDLIWIKNRTDNSTQHLWTDTVRGIGSQGGANILYSDSSEVESTNADTTFLSSFDSNGFTIGSSSVYNNSGKSYVAWCWKAGGTAVPNSVGTIASSVSANPAGGFSIVRNTGTASYTDTIGTGLNQAPELVIQKPIGSVVDWYVLFNISGTGAWDYGKLNESDQFTTDNPQRFATSATTINNWGWNGYDMINYCFHSVAGYQKIGTYNGDGSTTGPVINTGFEPAWLMIKRTDSPGGWRIQDNKRLSEGFGKDVLEANDTAAEQDNYVQIAFLTNGFQLHSTAGDYNANGGTYLYLAIAADADTTTPTLANSFANSLHVGNGTTQTIGGHLNGAAQFNGSSSEVNITGQLPSSVASDYAVSCWVNPNALSSSGHALFTNLFAGGAYATGQAAILIWNSKIRLYLSHSGTSNTYVYDSAIDVPTGLWSNIVVNIDVSAGTSSIITAYLNGVSNNLTYLASTNVGPNENNNTVFGKFQGISFYDGSIDQVRIYSSALTASQVSQLYNETTATANTLDFPTGAGCVAAYPLDSNGDDLSGNFNASSIPNVTFSNSITFRPDWSWVKNRQVSASHALFDSVRGAMRIVSTESLSTQSDLSPYGVTSFNNYGITVKDITSGNYGVNGAAGGTYSGTPPNYVSWNWKLNKRGTILTNATSLAVDVVANVNDAAGLSVVKGTLNVGSGVTKIPHGLSAAPEFVVAKSTGPGSSETSGWQVYHSSQGAGNYATINSTDAFSPNANVWANTTPDAELVSVQGGYVLYGGADFIMYSWRSISGYSKVGSYAGNGGTKDIYTTDDGSSGGNNPFQPKWVLIKNISSGYSWVVTDAARGTNKVLYTNLAQGEDTVSNGITAFNSNGFSLGSAVSFNDGSSTYVYLAIGG